MPQAQAHAHQVFAGYGLQSHQVQGPQNQYQHMLYVNPNLANLAHLRVQQSEKAAIEQLCARLSLEDAGRSSLAASAPVTASATAATPSEVLARPASVPIVASSTAIGSAELTAVRGATGTAGVPRIILGPDGQAIVPPPDPFHPGCELSVPMAEALQKYCIPHCCDYLVAKDLLRDKVSKQEFQ